MSVLTKQRKAMKLSERHVATMVGLARETVRLCERALRQSKIENIATLAQLFDRQVLVAVVPNDPAVSDLSTVAVSLAVRHDGFESWKIHFMDLVDEFRRSSDVRLVLLPPVRGTDERLYALLAATVNELCIEAAISTPEWARREYYLAQPWFVSGMESLKASALLESPLAFRRNNIFVHDNFLKRV